MSNENGQSSAPSASRCYDAVRTERQTSTLCRWWAKLNRWQWPDDIPGKPDTFDDGSREHQLEIVAPLMQEIERKTAKRDRLKWHNAMSQSSA